MNDVVGVHGHTTFRIAGDLGRDVLFDQSVHLRTLFRWRSIDGMRPTELADEVWLSKQALNDLLRDLEDWGYVRLEVNPDDRRSRIIRLTAKGRRLYEAALVAARQVESDLQDTLGAKRFAMFRDMLMEVVRLASAGERADGQIRRSAALSARR